MNNRFDKRLLLVSLFLHILVVLTFGFVAYDAKMKGQFIAYGCHSRHTIPTFYRPMAANNTNYQKYFGYRKNKPSKTKLKNKTKNGTKISNSNKNKKLKAKKKPAIAEKPSQKKKNLKKKIPAKKVEPEEETEEDIEKDQKTKNDPENKKNSVDANQDSENPDSEEEIIYFNLLGDNDPNRTANQKILQKEIDRVWSPMIGVPKGTECLARLVIAKDGSVKSLDIVKESDVPIFDLSIVKIQNDLKLPVQFFGKIIEIRFRQ